MEGETPSANQDVPRDDNKPSESECNAKVSLVSINWVLPDDLLEQILACLPYADLVRASAVCARWRGIITSGSFQKKLLRGVSQRPWFVVRMFLGPGACAYDPVYSVWYKLELPRFNLSSASKVNHAFSTGLVSIFGKGNDGINSLYVLNLLRGSWRVITRAPRVEYVHRTTLVISVSRTTPGYKISFVTTKDLPGVQVGRELSIHLYDSTTDLWETRMTEVLRDWRSGCKSAICDGVLYILMYSTSNVSPENSHGLVKYDLSGGCSDGLLASFVPVPCALTCGRLMNMKEKLVLVGGIRNDDRALFKSMKGVSIWVLNGREWRELARLPDDFFQGFGSDPWLKSCGLNDLIYIRSGQGHIVTFDVNQKHWSRISLAKVPSRVHYGFCFEQQLKIVP